MDSKTKEFLKKSSKKPDTQLKVIKKTTKLLKFNDKVANKSYKPLMFGAGNANASICIVTPKNCDDTLIVFERIFENALKIPLRNLYITNLIKGKAVKDKNENTKALINILKKELEIVSPKLLITTDIKVYKVLEKISTCKVILADEVPSLIELEKDMESNKKEILKLQKSILKKLKILKKG